MKPLVLLRRPGIIVVYGTITDVRSDEITIQNPVYLPVSKRWEVRDIVMKFPKGKFDAMSLKPGAIVIASTRDNWRLGLLFDNSQSDDMKYDVSCYNIRYSGSFDFEPIGTAREQHVFFGYVDEIHSSVTQSGDKRAYFNISWRKEGRQEYRTILCSGKDDSELSSIKGKNVILVCGAEKTSKTEKPYYELEQYYA